MANWWVNYITQRARAYGLDPRAVLAVAKQEGLGGGVGDQGTSFGPFQLHVGGALPPGKGRAWAESPAGIDYALSRMSQVARGQKGAQAIQSIVSRFERPANPSREIQGAISAYGGPLPSGGSGVAQLLGAPQQQIQSSLNPRAMLASALITANQASSHGQTPDYSQLASLVSAARQPAASAPMGTAATGTALRSTSDAAGGFLPSGSPYTAKRADQGRDFQTAPGAAVIAPGDGVVVAVKSDPHGFGPSYPIVRFVSGPYAGSTIYIGHTISAVRPGQRVRQGQVISRTGTRPIGNASQPGWGEIGYAPGGNPGSFGQRTPF